MKSNWLLAAVLCLPAGALAQDSVPAGTILPVSLDQSLNAAKVHAGQAIRAEVMQDVPGTDIRRRARVVGQVVQAGDGGNGQSNLEIRFDGVEIHGKMVAIRTSLRALASLVEVQAAQMPTIMSDRGMTPETWPTEQIGGDQVYRGGGPVAEGDTPVGSITPWGALGVPRAQSGESCRGVVADNSRPQAMWLFSVDACGAYGLPDIHIDHYGRYDAMGTIVLSSKNGKLKLGNGSAMLLRVS